jgi:hypothetical protein
MKELSFSIETSFLGKEEDFLGILCELEKSLYRV